MDGLNLRQQRFVQEYLIDLNGTRAYKVAYEQDDDDAACAAASRLLADGRVIQAVDAGKAAYAANASTMKARIVRELARIAFSDARLLYRVDGSLKAPHEWDDDTAAVIAGVEVFEEFEGRGKDRQQIGFTKKVKRWDKPKALELLGKHHAMFTDKVAPVNPDGSAYDAGSLEARAIAAELRAALGRIEDRGGETSPGQIGGAEDAPGPDAGPAS